MRRLTISEFKSAILSLHGARARVVSGESALIPGDQPPRELLVLIFELLDHPSVRRCYAWEQDGRVVAVLHGDSTNTPQAAVRSVLARPRPAPVRTAARIAWSFRTSVGLLRIRPSRSGDDQFELWLGEVPIRSYPSPEIAADDVFLAITGGPDELDRVLEVEAPSELSQWIRHERG